MTVREESEKVLEKLKEATAEARDFLSTGDNNDVYHWCRRNDHFHDPKAIDSVIAFRQTLEAVKQVFGEENLTEQVMINAIDAASYISVRTIMGEATPLVERRAYK